MKNIYRITFFTLLICQSLLAKNTDNFRINNELQVQAVCTDLVVELDNTGNAFVVGAEIGYNSTSSAGNITDFMVEPSTFDCSFLGDNQVFVTVFDDQGNSGTCNASVTVVDATEPELTCQSFLSIQLDCYGEAVINPAELVLDAIDNCYETYLSHSQLEFSNADLGIVSVLSIAEDYSGNTATCITEVSVNNFGAPWSYCQDIEVELDPTGEASISFEDIDNGTYAPCGIADTYLSITYFDVSNLGVNYVELTVADYNGNTSSCTSEVTVIDSTPPNAICQDISLDLDANGSASITSSDIDNGSTDNSFIVQMTLDQSIFDCSHIGANNIQLTVVDNSGNTSTCNATVSIEDNISPIAICQDIIVELDQTGNATIIAAEIDGGSNDNCGISASNIDQNTFSAAELGSNMVTCSVVDDNGNIATCIAAVTVMDNLPPAANCQDISVTLDGNGNAIIIPADIDNGSTDNAGIESMYLDNSDFNSADIGLNTVTLTVTDFSGNTNDCSAVVTVVGEDSNPPVAICQDISINLDATGNVNITTADINNESTANGIIVQMTLDKSDFNCNDLGIESVVLTVTDDSGNSSNCTASVIVEDSFAPTMLCKDKTIELNELGIASITLEDIDNGSSDNCFMMLSASKLDFNSGNIGSNNVVLTGTDVSGNASTCISLVEVLEFPEVAPHEQAVAFSHPSVEEYEGQDGIQHGEIESQSNVRSVEEISMSIFPNPSLNGNTTVVLKNMNNIDNEVTIILYDAAGTAIRYERRIIQGQQAKIKIDGLETYVTGVYTLQAIVNGRTMSEQLIIR